MEGIDTYIPYLIFSLLIRHPWTMHELSKETYQWFFSIEKIEVLLFRLIAFPFTLPVPNGVDKARCIATIVRSASGILSAHDAGGALLVAALLIKTKHFIFPMVLQKRPLILVLLFVHDLPHVAERMSEILLSWKGKGGGEILNGVAGTWRESRKGSYGVLRVGRVSVGKTAWSLWKARDEEQCFIS